MGSVNEIQKTVRISYGDNSIELTIENDGIHISAGNKQIILDSDIRRDSDKPFEHNSLVIKQDLDRGIDIVRGEIANVENDVDNVNKSLEGVEISLVNEHNTIESFKNNITNIENDVKKAKEGISKINGDVNQMQGNLSTLNRRTGENTKDLNTNTKNISSTNTKIDTHISKAGDEIKNLNNEIKKVERDSKSLTNAKKAYDIMAERLRIRLEEEKNKNTKQAIQRHPSPQIKIIKKTGWELAKQMAKKEMEGEGIHNPSEHDILQWAYMNEGYDVITAGELAYRDINGGGCRCMNFCCN